MGVVLRQAWSESQWTVLVGYLTISTNVRRYQTHHRWQLFSFRKTAHRCILCVTQSNWGKMWFLRFRVLPGSAEAHVTWGGTVKRLLIAYFIWVTFLPKISKSIHVCQSYSKAKVGRFLGHGVYLVSCGVACGLVFVFGREYCMRGGAASLRADLRARTSSLEAARWKAPRRSPV